MGKKIYRSGIDWWVWCIYLFAIVILIVCCIGTGWLVTIPLCVGMPLLFLLLIGGCWYVIDGDQLIVYRFFMPHRFPIAKIKEAKKTIGYLATAGCSSRRVSIRFVDRSVTRSSMPLEISPRDRDGFIAHLKSINPAIVTD